MPVIDFHTHAFPEALAARAVPKLAGAADVKAKLDGRISSLLKSMDEAGIERSVICSIATKPEHFGPILKWSQEIASERIVPLASVHPADPLAAQRVRAVARAGLRGIKLHPYYQSFDLDEERALPIYEAAQECGLIVLCHTGFDIAYPRDRKCDPARTARVIELFPKLALVTSHLGAWEDWDEVRKYLLGKPVYMETSFSIPYLGRPAAKALIEAHPPEYLLFGTDSPWADQKAGIAEIRSLRLPAELEERILYENARRLLDSKGSQKDEL
jgi:predicted TIM-barrel fold metal-dependent hydrolase